MLVIPSHHTQVGESDITSEIVDQLKGVAPKLTGIIEAHGEGDPVMIEGLFKAMEAADDVLRLYKDVVAGVTAVPILPPSRYV